jgi:putative FmdB family regulatory protein
MPIYEYACRACGAQSEISHRISDPPATVCPVCGKPELSKQISAAGFRLKGSGWYETDFKSGNKRNLAGEGKPDAGSAAGDGAKAAPGDKAAPADKPSSTPAPAPASSPSGD